MRPQRGRAATKEKTTVGDRSLSEVEGNGHKKSRNPHKKSTDSSAGERDHAFSLSMPTLRCKAAAAHSRSRVPVALVRTSEKIEAAGIEDVVGEALSGACHVR